MKKPEVFFHPISGSSILSITWYDGPLGDAVEANNEVGIGFFAHNGDLLSVQFDDVEEDDHQFLEFDRYKVEVTVKKGKVSFKLDEKKKPVKSGKKKVA
jgi:hypothetical protein